MSQNEFGLSPRQFYATKGSAAGQVLIFAGMPAATQWLTFGSLDPKFWSNFYYVELDFIGCVMNLFPVMVRVLLCGALTMLLINTILTKPNIPDFGKRMTRI